MLYVSRVFQWERRLARMLEMQKCTKSYVQLKRLRPLHRRVCRLQYKGSKKRKVIPLQARCGPEDG